MDKKTSKLVEEFRHNPQNVDFDDLLKVCKALFEDKGTKGSHHLFGTGLPNPLALVNLQRTRAKQAKAYQVKQVLKVIDSKFGDGAD